MALCWAALPCLPAAAFAFYYAYDKIMVSFLAGRRLFLDPISIAPKVEMLGGIFFSPQTKRGTGSRMSNPRRFVTAAEKVDVQSPWTLEEWFCRGDVVDNKELLMVRANMEPGRCHPFHTHPTREEIIFIISGRAEQWVGKEHRILGPGEMAFIPMGEVHGTYNPFNERLVFLAILSPSGAAEPGIVDVSTEEPWSSLRGPEFPPCT